MKSSPKPTAPAPPAAPVAESSKDGGGGGGGGRSQAKPSVPPSLPPCARPYSQRDGAGGPGRCGRQLQAAGGAVDGAGGAAHGAAGTLGPAGLLASARGGARPGQPAAQQAAQQAPAPPARGRRGKGGGGGRGAAGATVAAPAALRSRRPEAAPGRHRFSAGMAWPLRPGRPSAPFARSLAPRQRPPRRLAHAPPAPRGGTAGPRPARSPADQPRPEGRRAGRLARSRQQRQRRPSGSACGDAPRPLRSALRRTGFSTGARGAQTRTCPGPKTPVPRRRGPRSPEPPSTKIRPQLATVAQSALENRSNPPPPPLFPVTAPQICFSCTGPMWCSTRIRSEPGERLCERRLRYPRRASEETFWGSASPLAPRLPRPESPAWAAGPGRPLLCPALHSGALARGRAGSGRRGAQRRSPALSGSVAAARALPAAERRGGAAAGRAHGPRCRGRAPDGMPAALGAGLSAEPAAGAP
ncbi:transcription initiation factor TFIID subunit 4-like [Pituophis catenifer annectens]|uniref:transcription initiation factor TFIID subunit 4-like n=1 Tax=Pituophis catenifer annectens TaxID=94852 RepID=UPI00399397C7